MNFKDYIYCFLIFVPIIFLTSCGSDKHQIIPAEIKNVLEKAGANRIELEKVIKHYNSLKDSLELKSAYFLIKNMDGRFYYDEPIISQYSQYFKLIRNDEKNGEFILKALGDIYGPIIPSQLQKKYDLQHVKSQELIKNIDLSFKVWRGQPWKKQISFGDFCEYILPFRIEDEGPGNDRELFYNRFNHLLKPIIEQKGDLISACEAINNDLRKNLPWLLSFRLGFLPHFPASEILENKVGSCRDMCDLGVYAMRANGIPTSIDFVPQWPTRNMGHSWNRLVLKGGRNIMFTGGDDNPDTINRKGKMGKVYRHTYSKNSNSLAMQAGPKDDIPSFFRNPRIKDVTEEYVKCYDVSIPIGREKVQNENYVYLSVFNNIDWTPINWGKFSDNHIKFNKNEGDGIVYLPEIYKNGKLIPITAPFILGHHGLINYLIPKYSTTIRNMHINQISPASPALFKTKNLLGGKFQGANYADFRDAVDIFEIVSEPLPEWNRIKLREKANVRYIRYLSGPRMFCNIGEIKFFNSSEAMKGKVIGTEGSKNNLMDRTFEKAFNGDQNTFYESKLANNAWVGLEFEKAMMIDEINFLPRQDTYKDMKIVENHLYELMCWKNNQWISIAIQKAQFNYIEFKDVPSNGLYILKDRTKKVGERIFTYDNESIV